MARSATRNGSAISTSAGRRTRGRSSMGSTSRVPHRTRKICCARRAAMRAAPPASGPAGASVPTSACPRPSLIRSEEHTSELQSLMRISYAVFCLKKKKQLKQLALPVYTTYNMQCHHTTTRFNKNFYHRAYEHKQHKI